MIDQEYASEAKKELAGENAEEMALEVLLNEHIFPQEVADLARKKLTPDGLERLEELKTCM